MCSKLLQSCPTLCDPMDCSLSGSSVHGIFQARILELIAISFSRGFSQPRNWTQVSCIAGRFFPDWAMREAPKRVSSTNSPLSQRASHNRSPSASPFKLKTVLTPAFCTWCSLCLELHASMYAHGLHLSFHSSFCSKACISERSSIMHWIFYNGTPRKFICWSHSPQCEFIWRQGLLGR